MSNTDTLVLPEKMTSVEFEMMCCDIMERYFTDGFKDRVFPNKIPFYHLYGRNGQNQHGIDIISRDPVDERGYCVVQCKNYYDQSSGKLLVNQVHKDIDSIYKYKIPISKIIIMTSLHRDTFMQDCEMELNRLGREVTVFFWEDIAKRILNDPWLLSKWYPQYAGNRELEELDKPLTLKCPLCHGEMMLTRFGEEFMYECNSCYRRQKINIFVSLSSPINREQIVFREALWEYLKKHGMDAVTLGYNIYDMEYPLRGIRIWMGQCYGMICIAFRRSYIQTGVVYKKAVIKDKYTIQNENEAGKSLNEMWLTSPFCHIETAMAFQLNIPILVFRESGVVNDGMLEAGNMGLYMPEFSLDQKNPEDYMNSKEFNQLMSMWMERVKSMWNKYFKD